MCRLTSWELTLGNIATGVPYSVATAAKHAPSGGVELHHNLHNRILTVHKAIHEPS